MIIRCLCTVVAGIVVLYARYVQEMYPFKWFLPFQDAIACCLTQRVILSITGVPGKYATEECTDRRSGYTLPASGYQVYV